MISDGKFSYCIKANSTHRTYFKVWQACSETKKIHKLRAKIMQAKPSSAYYVNLLGINVNGVKLNISKTDLAIEKDGGGGCVIDCGTLATLLVEPIFYTLHTALADHLSSNQNLKRRIIHKLPKDLCCEELSDDGRCENLPVVTFHFENAGLDVKPEAVFMFREFESKILFCLSMLSDDSIQYHNWCLLANEAFVYDTKAQVLGFGLEDCEKNG